MVINPFAPAKTAAAGIVAAAFVVAGLSWFALRPAAAPAQQQASAPAAEFSAERAMAHVRFLAERPRPLASAANAEAREYILDQLRGMGLEPEVQTATAQKTSIDRSRNAKVVLGVVHNIVVRLPGNGAGHASRAPLLLATGYDTAERSVGAAAAAAPVAALLETLRILQAGAPLANDIAVLFADGERVGGLGARAFAGQHPLAKRVGLVIRFDGGGSEGPLVLIGASGDDRAAVSGWADAAPHARGSSAMPAVYRMMAGALEMGALGKIGSARLQFANVEGSNGAGIGSRDTPGRLDIATVQSTGETMLALARHFGQAPSSAARAGYAVYFTLPVIGAVSYSAGSVWMLTRLTCLMFLIVCWMAVQRGDAEPGDIANGAIGFAFIAALIMLGAFAAWQAMPSLHRGYDFHAYGAGARDDWFLGGFAAFGTGLYVVLQRGFRRSIGQAATALGPLLVMLLLLLAASWKLPGASYLLAWPLMGTLLAYGALYAPFARALPGYRRALIQFAGVAPALLLVGPLVKAVYTATSPENLNLPMAVLAMLLGLATLMLTAQRRFIVRGLAAVGVACFAVAGSAAPYGDAPIPQPNRMVYLKDAYTWKSYWMLPAIPLDAWSKQFFPNATRPQVQVDAFGYGSPKMWLAQAPRTPLGFPGLTVLKDDDDGNKRAVEFTLQGKAAVPFIDVTISGTDAYRTTVNGRVLTSEKANTWTLSMYGMGEQRLDFRFDLQTDKLARVFVHERIPGLPQHDIAPRPAGMQPPLTPGTASTILSDTLVFR